MITKKLSKVISLLIATAMLLALTVPALAVGGEPLANPVYKFIKAEGNTAIEGNAIEISKSTPIKLEKENTKVTDFDNPLTNVVSSDTSIVTVAYESNNVFKIIPVKNSTTPVTITYTDANDQSEAILTVTVSGIAEPVYVFADPKGRDLPLTDGKFLLNGNQPIVCEIKKDNRIIGDLGNIADTVKSSSANVTIGADANNKHVFIINPVANGDTTITYTNGSDTATLDVTVSGIAATTYGFAENIGGQLTHQVTSATLSSGDRKYFQMEMYNGSTHIGNSQKFVLGDNANTTLSSNPCVALSVSPDGWMLEVTPIKDTPNGTPTIITYTANGKIVTLAVEVTNTPAPENKEIDADYINRLKSKNFDDLAQNFIFLENGVTITEDPTGKIKAVKVAYGDETFSYLLLPTDKATTAETIELTLSDSSTIKVAVAANLPEYYIPLLEHPNKAGIYTPTLFFDFPIAATPKTVNIKLHSNITTPGYRLIKGNEKSFTFALNTVTNTITGTTDIVKNGVEELFGTFSLYTGNSENFAQFTVQGHFSEQGEYGNFFYKDGDRYISESVYDKESKTVLFTIANIGNGNANRYWSPWQGDTNPKNVDNSGLESIKFEIPAEYTSLNLSLENDGVPTLGNYTYMGETFNVYGLKVNGTVPEGTPVYLKQAVTYKNDVSVPNNPYHSYFMMGGEGITNPEPKEYRMAEHPGVTIQQAIYEQGEGITIILEPGKTYTENIQIPYCVEIRGAGADKNTIKAPDGGKPVLTITSFMRPVGIYNLTIDGNANKSVGVETVGGGFVGFGNLNSRVPGELNCVIQNCSTGIRAPRDGGIISCEIKNNGIGIEFFQEMRNGIIAENKITGNGVGVKFTTGYSAPSYGGFEIQRNVVTDNTTKNIKADGGFSNIEFRNNFIELADGKPDMGKIELGNSTALKIEPYFMTADMGKVTADVKTLGIVDGKLEIPYVTRDVNNNGAPIVDKKVFEDISGIPAAKGRAASSAQMQPVIVQGYVGNKPAYSFSIDEITKPMDFNSRFDEKVKTPGIIDRTNYKDTKYRIVSFKHNGDLPGQTVVTLRDDSGKYEGMNGQKLKLYLLNDATGKLELVGNDAVTVTEVDGVVYLTFVMDHCSDYLITDVDVTDKGTTNPPYYPPASSGGGSSSPTDVVDSGAVSDAVAEAKGGNASIDVSQMPIMSGEGFAELAKSPHIVLELKGDGFSWSFAGKDIDPKKLAGIAFNTQISKKSPNAAQLAKAAGNAQFESVYFGHHGALPGKATIKVQTGFRSRTVKVYYFNSASLNFEYAGDAVVDAYGTAVFSITHCSDYVLSETEISNSIGNPVKSEKPTKVPKTGVADDNWLNIIILIGMFYGAAIILVKKLDTSK